MVKWILTSPKGEFDEKGHTMTCTLSVTHRQKDRRIPGLVWTALARSQAHSSVPTSRAVSHWATAYRYKRLASLHRTFWCFCNKTELTASRFSHIARRCMDGFFEEKKKKRKKKSRLKPPLLSSGNGDKYKDHATKGKQPGTLIKKKKKGCMWNA